MHAYAHRTYRPIGIVAGVIAILLSATAARAQNQDGPNVAGVEILGRGIVYSGNYERYVKRIGLGVGVAAWHIDKTVLVVPMYVSFRPIGDTHSLYLATGATVGSEVSTLFTKPTAVYGTASVGYEHISKSGLVLRPTYTLLFGRGGNLLWPGFLIGYRF